MIFQTESAEIFIVCFDVLVQLLDFRLVAIRVVAHDETLVQLDDLAEVQLLTRRFI